MIVKDSIVLIHLAKISLLEKCCKMFYDVKIPQAVYEEIMEGEKHGYEDVQIVKSLVDIKKIKVVEVTDGSFVIQANNFNIFRGEAEAVALYWQENAEFLATDDNNVRKKKKALKVKVIGTPSILVKLLKKKIISKEKYLESVKHLKKIGWFSSVVMDKLKMEVK